MTGALVTLDREDAYRRLSVAREVADPAPLAVESTKRGIDACSKPRLAGVLTYETMSTSTCAVFEDRLEGYVAGRAKRRTNCIGC